MTQQSARTMMWVSIVLLVLGGMVTSPEAGVVGASLAALLSVGCVLFGTKWVKVAGVVILLASIELAVSLLPAAEGQMEKYRDRARRSPSAVPQGTPESK